MSKIGLQLYTLRDDLKKDYDGVVREVAKMGYEGIEIGGGWGEPTAELKLLLTETQLKVAGVGYNLEDLETRAGEAAAYAQALQSPFIITFWLQEPLRNSKEACLRTAERFNRVGEELKANGIQYLYHIHGYEFQDYGGQTGMDLMMAHTDPTYFNIEPDTYWVEHGGANALEFVQKYADRVLAIHMKDYIDKPEMHDIEVGDGAIDMAGIIRTLKGKNVQWYIVEQERYHRPPIESATICYQNLKRLLEENG